MQELLQTYGYLGLAIGTFLEGETIAVLAGFLAFRQLMSFQLVVAAAFIGTVLGDQLYFHLGKKHGRVWIDRKPARQARAKQIETRIRRHETLVILAFRFVYGTRTITPVLLGASGTHWLKFLLLNIVSAAAWSLTVVSLGYFFGSALEPLLGHIKQFELIAGATIVLAGLLIWGWHRLHGRLS